MQRMEEWEQIKKEYREVEIPKNGSAQMLEAMARAKRDRKKLLHLSRYATVAAAMLLVLLLPNVNREVASAMSEVPVLGGFFRLITIEQYTEESETAVLHVAVPKLEAVGNSAGMEPEDYDATIDEVTAEGAAVDGAAAEEAKKVADISEVKLTAPQTSTEAVLNQEFQTYTESLVDEYKKYTAAGSRISQSMSYEVITNTEEWFSIRLMAETVMADGYTEYTYYTLRSDTKQRVYLSDFLPTEQDRSVVAKEVLRQMEERMAVSEEVYFTDRIEDVAGWMTEEQSFYINTEGHLVIAFNELEVAPGFMGCVEFEIPDELVPGLK